MEALLGILAGVGGAGWIAAFVVALKWRSSSVHVAKLHGVLDAKDAKLAAEKKLGDASMATVRAMTQAMRDRNKMIRSLHAKLRAAGGDAGDFLDELLREDEDSGNSYPGLDVPASVEDPAEVTGETEADHAEPG